MIRNARCSMRPVNRSTWDRKNSVLVAERTDGSFSLITQEDEP